MKLKCFSRFMFLTCATIQCLSATSVLVADQPNFSQLISAEKPGNSEDSLNNLTLADALFYNTDDAYLYRVHQDAYYHLTGISDLDSIVQLHDGSKWQINQRQAYIVSNMTNSSWVQKDDILIKPNTSWFSSYKYVLYNRTTQQSVEANLIVPPSPVGASTLFVLNINYGAGLVQLSDNTVWQMDYQDSYFSYWQIGQRIVIGVNNNLDTCTFPHALINVDLYKSPYSQADFYGYTLY